jgi:3',5'-cyclic AMP phosphodiesterase CpdA
LRVIGSMLVARFRLMPQSKAVIRVLHFSDVHVQESVFTIPPLELMGKRALAIGNLWLTRGRLFRESVPKLHALGRFAEEERVDFAICSGDYTAVGTEAEYKSVRRAIDSLVRAPLGFCTVPGNHDLYLADTVRHSRFERHFGDFTVSDWPEYATGGPYPFVRLVEDELAIVGVNSSRPNPSPFTSAGRIPDAQLAALERILADPRLGTRQVIVMTHYAPLRRDGTPDSLHHGLENASELTRICARPRVMIAHGHIHGRYCHPSVEGRPWIFCAGSTTQRDREGFWLYEFEPDRMLATPGNYFSGQYMLARADSIEVRL